MDYDVWYAGAIIGNLQARDKTHAKRLAAQKYKNGNAGTVTVCPTDGTKAQIYAAKEASLLKRILQ